MWAEQFSNLFKDAEPAKSGVKPSLFWKHRQFPFYYPAPPKIRNRLGRKKKKISSPWENNSHIQIHLEKASRSIPFGFMVLSQSRHWGLIGDKERTIWKLFSIPLECWAKAASKQESCARVWIFSSLSSDSFDLNTVARWVLCFFFPKSSVSLLICNGWFFSHLPLRQNELFREMGALWRGVPRTEAGRRTARARARPGVQTGTVAQFWWGPQKPGTYSQTFVRMHLPLRSRNTHTYIDVWPSIRENQTFALLHHFPHFCMLFFFSRVMESIVCEPW